MPDKTFSCIIPTITKDYLETRDHLYKLFDMLAIDKLIFLAPEKLRDKIRDDARLHNVDERVSFVNGNDIIPFSDVEAAYEQRIKEIAECDGKPERLSSAGWYYQQFLKMAYSYHCNDEYYLTWDADTIPLRKIDMFHPSGIPYLFTKVEYMSSYFLTLKNLLGFDKVIDRSFICGHMLFKTSLMQELINEIMATSFSGKSFYEKIFNAIKQPHNGFSEFETYGTWAAIRHPDSYKLREWKSIRNTNFLIDRKDLTKEDLNWLATGFDAANFERYMETFPELTNLFRNPSYREKLTADVFYEELLKMGVFGEYRNGGLIVDENIIPV